MWQPVQFLSSLNRTGPHLPPSSVTSTNCFPISNLTSVVTMTLSDFMLLTFPSWRMVMRGCTCCPNKYTWYTWFGHHSRAVLHHGGPGEAGQLPLQRPAGLRGHVPTVSQGAQPRKVPPIGLCGGSRPFPGFHYRDFAVHCNHSEASKAHR